MQKRHCKGCGRLFPVCPRVANHRYCKKTKCKRARKREWQRKKLSQDKAYRENKHDAQKRWAQAHPDYWSKYREDHPAYTKGNRDKQVVRNRLRRQKRANASILTPIAKMDAISKQHTDFSGIYKLSPVQGQGIAKMDAIIVQMSVISRDYSHIGGDCKDRTR